MAFQNHKNFAFSLVATAPSPASSGTSLIVTAGEGTVFPTAPFQVTIWPSGVRPTRANAEICQVTVVSTDTLTITRAQESSSARAIVIGDNIAATITVLSLTDIETKAALLAAQNTFASTSGQIIQGPIDITGASAGQIKFPATQNPSSDVNTLDDYEEGTWTPIIGSSGGASTGQSYSAQSGAYIKIGRLVWVQAFVVLSNKGTIPGGSLVILGAPFSIVDEGSASFSYWIAMTTAAYMLTGEAVAGTSLIYIKDVQTATGGINSLATTEITNTTGFIFFCVYRTTA